MTKESEVKIERVWYQSDGRLVVRVYDPKKIIFAVIKEEGKLNDVYLTYRFTTSWTPYADTVSRRNHGRTVEFHDRRRKARGKAGTEPDALLTGLELKVWRK